MSRDEPTLSDVLDEVKGLRAAMVTAFADQRRDFQRRFEGFQRTVHLEIRAVDGRLAVIEAAVEDLRGEVREVRDLASELLGLAHTHPEES